mmetsp:Transcript_11268/g.69619  ORF Transcript_11268/g.69619 Transcript_11268/m.69619 type:complete len:148 (+) Transcript_11268:2675-3118(+)
MITQGCPRAADSDGLPSTITFGLTRMSQQEQAGAYGSRGLSMLSQRRKVSDNSLREIMEAKTTHQARSASRQARRRRPFASATKRMIGPHPCSLHSALSSAIALIPILESTEMARPRCAILPSERGLAMALHAEPLRGLARWEGWHT